MNYQEAINYIDTAGLLGSKPGLGRIEKLCKLLGNPQDSVNFIHIAGTNGKGSVCAMLNSILISAGFKVGLFTSPHLCDFRERIKINGSPISQNQLADIIERIKGCTDKMNDKPTEFEIATAAAFVCFKQENCDIGVLETGLGGRLDATNIIKSPLLSVITGVDLDHTNILGETIEKIACEKAGIIKENSPLLLARVPKGARGKIKEIARQYSAPVTDVDYNRIKNTRFTLSGADFMVSPHGKVHLSLPGIYQVDNALTAVTACEILQKNGIKTEKEHIKEGLKGVCWQARFEVLSKKPVIIYDGAHNTQGVTALINNIKTLVGGKAIFVCGVMEDKEYHRMAELLAPYIFKVFTVTPDNSRALDSAQLKNVFSALGVNAEAVGSVSEGVTAAINSAKKESLPLIICGSLYMYSEVSKLNIK